MSPRDYEDYGRQYGPEGMPWIPLLRLAPWVLVGLLALFLLWNSFHTVAPHEQAVVLRFGQYHTTRPPGLHFKIPLVDQALRVDTSEQGLRLPFGIDVSGRVLDPEAVRDQQQEPLILTGDLYAGLVEWNVRWRVVEPKDYLFSIDAKHVQRLIIGVARAVMHRSVGDYSADEVLTGKREEIGLAAWKEMQSVLDSYQCGINVVALQMQRVIPPERVKPSFDEVNASIQQRDQLVNEANRERNRLIPQAEATRDKLIRQAEGYAARRRAEADGEITALLAKYRAYQEAPDITRRRLYLEAVEEVFSRSGPKTVLDADLRGLLPWLNVGEDRALSREKPPEGKP
ncbi:MAG: FtsH protease activity modulator HflK [Gemmataceae bacterium]|nr:FtsH protease activity modulator HflK [Gemmataceae bacterium]